MEKRLRTFILRKVKPTTTTMTIFNDLTKTLNQQDISSIFRDELDSRRFYITFATTLIKRTVLQDGFMTCGLHIKPQKHDFTGFMPYPPPFLTDEEILHHLETFGKVLDHRFITAKGSQTRVGGLEFKLRLKDGLDVWPTHITVDNTQHRILDRDDRQQCSSCKLYGHIKRHCKKSPDLNHQQQQQRQQLRDKVEVEMEEEDDRSIDESDSEEEKTREREKSYSEAVQQSATTNGSSPAKPVQPKPTPQSAVLPEIEEQREAPPKTKPKPVGEPPKSTSFSFNNNDNSAMSQSANSLAWSNKKHQQTRRETLGDILRRLQREKAGEHLQGQKLFS